MNKNVDDWHERLIVASEYRYHNAVEKHHKDQYQWKETIQQLRKSRNKIYLQSNGEAIGIPNAIKHDSFICKTFKSIMKEEETIELHNNLKTDALSNINQNIVKRKLTLIKNPEIDIFIRRCMQEMELDEETVWSLYENGALMNENDNNHNEQNNVMIQSEIEFIDSPNKKHKSKHSSQLDSSSRYNNVNNMKEITTATIVYDLTKDEDAHHKIIKIPSKDISSNRSSIIDLTEDIIQLNPRCSINQTNHISIPIFNQTNDASIAITTISNTNSIKDHRKYLENENLYTANNSNINNYTILIDKRERKNNDNYRALFKSIQKHTNEKTVNIGTEEIQLHIGDFMLCLTNDSDNNDKNQYIHTNVNQTTTSNIVSTADMIIERKCLNDIIQRSTEENEGPHYRQEKNLRYCGLKHPFFLIEGDLNKTSGHYPLVSNGKEEDQMERLDVIRDKDELVRYMIGITCRNVGEYHVNVLHTMNSTHTCMLIVALSTIIASKYSNKSRKHPNFQMFQRHWVGKTKNNHALEFDHILQQINISIDMKNRIKRRFTDEYYLSKVYELCNSNTTKYLLLCDLSSSPSNLNDNVLQNELTLIGTNQMKYESRRIYNHFYPLHQTTLTTINIKREVILNCNNYMLNKNPYLIDTNNIILKEISDQYMNPNEYAWCELFIKSSIHINDKNMNNNINNKFRRSGKIYMIVISGYEVIESLSDAYEIMNTNNNYNNSSSNNSNSSNSSSNYSNQTDELKLIHKSIEILMNNFPIELMNRITDEKDNNYYPQMIIFLDKLGNGDGNIGASGKLKSMHNKQSNLISRSNSNNNTANNNNNDSFLLDKKRKKLITMNAATYLTSKLGWLIHLFIAMLNLKYNYQIYHTSDSNTVEYFILMFMKEYKAQAYLLYEEDD